MAYTPRHPKDSMPVEKAVRQTGSVQPNCLYLYAPHLTRGECEEMAKASVEYIRQITPKLSGRGASGIKPYYGTGWFGIKWDRPYLWHLEIGTAPHTMRNLAGKVIPMWIDDPTGEEAKKNPKAKTRITENGRKQVLIFRRAAKPGQRKKVAQRDSAGRLIGWRDVPASFPGAPGRIARRSFHPKLNTNTGRIASLAPRPHVGVRWRHPGIVGREFMQYGLAEIGYAAGLPDLTIYATHRRS